MRVVPLALLTLLAGAAAAGEAAPVPRHVLALVPGTGPDPERGDVVHEMLEMPLNHLGLVVRRWPIGNGAPPEEWLDDARAVLTWFGADTPPEPWLWPWLEDVVAPRGLRVVHFGEFGPLQSEDPERLARWLARFGLFFDELFAAGPFGIEVSFLDASRCALEADPRFRSIHRGPRIRDGASTAWVTTRRRVGGDDVRHPVVVGPWGGIALDPWTLRIGSESQDRRWHLDPFAFLRDALGMRGVPAPHPSVRCGRRMWLLQVDGDGFESLTTVRPDTYAARVMQDEVFRRYPLPYTVSVIVASLTDDYAIVEPNDRMRLAQRIFSQANVEPASHGVLHTLRWREGPAPDQPPRYLKWYPGIANFEYTPVAEVRDSIAFIDERLCPPGKRCEVMLWTGFANPLDGPLAVVREAGRVNLNGGVFRWDASFDSVGFVSPWSRRVGRELQVYAGAANENDFDGFFDTMPGAFAHIDTTIERTGTPRILKPANVYCHFYSAETPARLEALQGLIERWALHEPTAPVFGSEYVRAVNSAVETARVLRTGDGWLLRGFGDCPTARLDDEPREVDFVRSRGLIGACRKEGSLYLHLAGGDADVVLADDAPRHAHVVESNAALSDVVLRPDGVEATVSAFCERVVVVGGLSPDAALSWSVDGGSPTEGRADAEGRLEIRLPAGSASRLATSRLEVAAR